MRHLGFLEVLVAQHLQRTGSMVQTKGCIDPGATSSGGTDSPRSTARKICLARYHGKAVQPASNNTVTLCSFFIESATNVQICKIDWFGKGKAHWLFLCGVPALESTTQCSFMFFYWPWPVQNPSEFHEFQSKGCFLSLERTWFQRLGIKIFQDGISRIESFVHCQLQNEIKRVFSPAELHGLFMPILYP